MKRYALLRLFPAGNFQSGNQVMAETQPMTRDEAVLYFQNQFPLIPLNCDGYCKVGIESFCIAECYDPLASSTQKP